MMLLLNGCIFPVMWGNPGYMIDIEAKKINRENVKKLEQSVRDQNYNLFTESNNRCIQFSKVVTADKQIKHPYVGILICYDENKEFGQITEFGTLIINEWEGQRPEIKQEINRMGDLLYDELVKFVGEENLTIERKATGPPF